MSPENDLSATAALPTGDAGHASGSGRNPSPGENLAEIRHGLKQSATVLLTSLELLLEGRQDDESSETQLLHMAYEAALEIRDCLAVLS